MLYETLFQQKILLCTIYFGIVSGLVFDVQFFACKIFANKKILKIIFEILFCIASALLFWLCIQKFNYGQFRLFELVGFCLGFLIEKFSVHKLLEKNFELIYNFAGKIFAKLKKMKLFAKIFK